MKRPHPERRLMSSRSPGGAEVVVFSQNASAEAEQPAQRGDAVWLHWDPANSYPIGSPR